MDRLPDPMSWLAAGVPLTLLIDLLAETGPHSERISAQEPAAAEWVRRTLAA